MSGIRVSGASSGGSRARDLAALFRDHNDYLNRTETPSTPKTDGLPKGKPTGSIDHPHYGTRRFTFRLQWFSRMVSPAPGSNMVKEGETGETRGLDPAKQKPVPPIQPEAVTPTKTENTSEKRLIDQNSGQTGNKAKTQVGESGREGGETNPAVVGGREQKSFFMRLQRIFGNYGMSHI
jgi:hypothetical protein